jgi:hypothetical protein
MSAEAVKSVIDTYVSAWNETDANALQTRLADCWDASGVYTDPNIQTKGRKQLADYMLGFHQNVPSATFVLTDNVVSHHGQLHIRWELVGPNRQILQNGNSFGEVSADGKLARMTGFFAN